MDADRSEKTRQTIRTQAASDTTERLRAGPFRFNVGLSYAGEYTDNVTLRETERDSDFIHRPQLDVHGFVPVAETGRFSVDFGIGYAKYSSHEELDHLDLQPDSELAYDFSAKDFRFLFYDRFNYSQEVQSVGGLSGVAEFPRFENTVGTRVTWVPSDWSYQAGYAHYNFVSTSSDFSYLDQSSEQFLARVGYGFAAATQAGLEASLALTDYDESTQADNTSSSVGPYLEWQITQALGVVARGGFTHYDFDALPTRPFIITTNSAAYGLDTYYAGLEVHHRLTDFISHSLFVVHEIRPGVNQGSDYIESTLVHYNATWLLTQHASLGLNFVYEQGTQTQVSVLGSGAEDYDRYGPGVTASYNLTARLTATASYDYINRTSNQRGRDYFENRASLRLRYQF